MKLFREVQEKGYSVRQVEDMVQALNNGETVKSGRTRLQKSTAKLPEEYGELRTRLAKFFGQKVQLAVGATGKGRITIPFADEEELERIMTLFDRMRK